MKICLWFSFYIVIRICVAKDNSTLKSVAVLFRHGDRNIQTPYPGDPYGNLIYWQGGYGQLTQAGKQRHYQLGKWFRQRYDGFLPRAYSVYDVHVQSTNMDRTLMSAAAHLAGLFPPPPIQMWDPNLLWQPIPIHTEPSVGLTYGSECPLYNKLYNHLLTSDEFAGIYTSVKDVGDYIFQFTGYKIHTLEELLQVYDSLLVEDQFGYELPKWSKAIYPKKLRNIAVLAFRSACYSPQLARLIIGGFIAEILTHFANVATGDPSQYKKYNIYSAHDVTIADVFNAFGINFQNTPPYGASLILEFRELEGIYFVNVFYKNSSAPPFELNVKGCIFNCPIETFVKILRPIAVTPDQRAKECFEEN